MDEKANASNHFAVCKACIQAVRINAALRIAKVTNVVESCIAHIKKCEHFAIQYSSEEIKPLVMVPKEKEKVMLIYVNILAQIIIKNIDMFVI